MLDTPEVIDACTPRQYQEGWFDKWDSWWIEGTGAVRDLVLVEGFNCPIMGQAYYYEGWSEIGTELAFNQHIDAMCLPIAQTGYPRPVGWHVLEE